ncbi:hypothetical protein L3Q82_015676, partial [Scortum barcoo]
MKSCGSQTGPPPAPGFTRNSVHKDYEPVTKGSPAGPTCTGNSCVLQCSEPGQADMVSLIRTPEQPRVCPFLWVHTVLGSAVMLTFTHLSDMIDRLLKYHRILGTQSSCNYELNPVEFYNVNTINQRDTIPDTESQPTTHPAAVSTALLDDALQNGPALCAPKVNTEHEVCTDMETKTKQTVNILEGGNITSELGHQLLQTVTWSKLVQALHKLKHIHPQYEDITVRNEAELCDPTLPDENDDDVDENMEDNDYDEDDLMDIDRFEINALNEAEHDDMLLCDEQPQEQRDDPEQEEKYKARPETPEFEEMCLADFASTCRIVYGQQTKGKHVLPLLNDMGFVQRRKTDNPAIIRFHRTSQEKYPEQFYGTLLKLYVPYRSDQELKREYLPTYESFYKAGLAQLPGSEHPEYVRHIVKRNRDKYEKNSEEIEKAVEEFEQNRGVIDEWCNLAPESEVVVAPVSALIAAVYRPPDYSVSSFLANLGSLLDSLEIMDCHPIIVCGDFNENIFSNA